MMEFRVSDVELSQHPSPDYDNSLEDKILDPVEPEPGNFPSVMYSLQLIFLLTTL
jgi:hypothetical protein